MNKALFSLVLFFLASRQLLANSEKCVPGKNCRLPDCRCWDDPEKPGNVKDVLTPQMVLFTFSYAFNNETIWNYLSLFEELYNPNDCPALGTFFVEYAFTNTDSLEKLHQARHELAITVANDRIPDDMKEWTESLRSSLEKVQSAGVPRSEVRGARGPELYIGGDDEMRALKNLSIAYDASCMSVKYIYQNNLLWPYTYDYNTGTSTKCDGGITPRKNYPGLWQYSIPAMKYKGTECSTLSSCSSLIHTAHDAYSILMSTFRKHYFGNRSPMVIFVHPEWFNRAFQVEGLLQFMNSVRQLKDSWFLTMSQALDWVRYPVPMYKSVRFLPWECPPHTKKFAKDRPRRR